MGYQRVPKKKLWSVLRICLLATLLASASGVLMLVLLKSFSRTSSQSTTLSLWGVSLLIITLGFGVPAFLAIRYHPRFKHWWHAFVFGGVYALMFVIVPALIDGLNQIIWALRFYPISVVLVAVLPLAILGACGGTVFLFLWAASRTSRGELLVQDGANCPACGYSLIGNTSGRCSECGHPFTVEDLGLSESDLQPAVST